MPWQVRVAGSAALAKIPGVYCGAALGLFCRYSLPGQKDLSCSSDKFLEVWFHLLYPSEDEVLLEQG